jgi:hypothetical protein
MTFSSASVSVREVDDVVASAAGGGGLRCGKAASWRIGGVAREVIASAAASLGAVAGVSAVVFTGLLAARLRAIGRGLGNGSFFDPAQAFATDAENPTANARRIANAVNRNAAARLDGVTMFLGGESINR